MAPNIPKFTLDADGARAWLTAQAELDDGTAEVEIADTWEPRSDFDIGSTVDNLLEWIFNEGFITHPWARSIIWAHYEGGEADYMSYSVDLRAPVEEYVSMSLSTSGCEGRKLGSGNAEGIDAAVDLLAEIVAFANRAIGGAEHFLAVVEALPAQAQEG